MSISFKKSMLAVTIVSSLTAGFSGIAAAAPKDHSPTAPITGVASTPGNPFWLVAGGHDGGGRDRGGRDHGGWGYLGFPYFMSGYGYDGMYQASPTVCENLAWRLERKHVPYWKEQAILAKRGCA
ncbi:MAG TPA: hypothetical protein VM144_04535 [Aestuariivirga sp.]|nr:hypothetical protein [Aestuariivirga sp.]